MLLKELIRFSTQHRTLYCYLILSIWIFLLIAGLEYFGYAKGMYKYIGTNGGSLSLFSAPYASTALATTGLDKEEAQKYRKFKERCTPLEHLLNQHNDEGGILEGFQLQGVLLVIRHGDRGPLSHVRDIGGINCGVQSDVSVNKYRSFLHNSSSTSGSNHMYWYKTGPFHSFALLPATEKTCQLGQLTYKGIAQLLHVGEILHQIYAYPLGLLTKQPPSKSAMNSTPYSLLYSDEVVVYTTRYRRTFQSALALLYTLLPVDKWLALNIRESHSMAFCFSDCACPKAEALRKLIATKNARQLSQHSGIKSIMHWFGQTLLQHTPNGISDLNEVVDAMLAVVCHDARWPHRRSAADGSHALPSSTPEPSTADLSDVINIDQDDTAANLVEPNANAGTAHHSGAGGLSNELPSGHSVGSLELGNESGDALALLSYANWQSMREAKSTHYKRMGLLRAYGMIRHIVSGMLRMISGDRTKIVLYSGHDWTLQFLTAALGIQTETTFIPYAARLSFELYKARSDYYFRVLYNGRDVTRQIDICEGGKSLRVTRDSRGNKADLCPIENIIRFLHEDYFAPLNATNFKDACFEPPKGKE